MNTPKLDAFLKEVDALDAKMRCGRIADAIGAAEEVVGYTPTLAAMLRVAVEALRVNAGVLQNSDKEKFPSHEMVALQWMERIAAGDQEVV